MLYYNLLKYLQETLLMVQKVIVFKLLSLSTSVQRQQKLNEFADGSQVSFINHETRFKEHVSIGGSSIKYLFLLLHVLCFAIEAAQKV